MKLPRVHQDHFDFSIWVVLYDVEYAMLTDHTELGRRIVSTMKLNSSCRISWMDKDGDGLYVHCRNVVLKLLFSVFWWLQ